MGVIETSLVVFVYILLVLLSLSKPLSMLRWRGTIVGRTEKGNARIFNGRQNAQV